MSQPEEWRPVPGYEGLYEISSFGQVRSQPRPRTRGGILKAGPDRGGYLHVNLCRDGQPRSLKIHRIVAAAFFGPCPVGHEVRHLNDDKLDNRVANLAYGTQSDNIRDSVRNKTHNNARKTHCPQGHPLSGANLLARSDGHRSCRMCKRVQQRALRRAQADGFLFPLVEAG